MALTPDAPSRKTAGDLEHSGYLRANALNLVGAVSIALGSAAPTASLALTLAAIVAVSGYASPMAILVCAIPMLGIAMAYRRLNMWEVNCGGTYVWAGRAISPYFGFMVGWTIILAYWVGAMSIVLPIGTYALQIFHNSYENSNTASAIIGTAALVFVTGVAYLGIKATARVQILLIAVEYIAISILGILGLIAVFGGDHRSVGFDWSWFSWSSLGGTSGFVAASLIAVYMFSGWDTAILVNEESENPRVTPGTAVILSVLGLAFIYSIFTFALQAAVKPAVLQAHSGDLLTYLGGEYSGSLLAKALILTVTLSAVGSALACLVSGARVAFAMGFDRVLPAGLRTHACAAQDPRPRHIRGSGDRVDRAVGVLAGILEHPDDLRHDRQRGRHSLRPVLRRDGHRDGGVLPASGHAQRRRPLRAVDLPPGLVAVPALRRLPVGAGSGRLGEPEP